MADICLCPCHICPMWVLCPENVDQIQRPSQVAKRIMATLFSKENNAYDWYSATKSEGRRRVRCGAYHTVIGFDLLSNSKQSPTEEMRRPFWQCSDTQFKSGYWQIGWTIPDKNVPQAKVDL
jgi:hypothetical protein